MSSFLQGAILVSAFGTVQKFHLAWFVLTSLPGHSECNYSSSCKCPSNEAVIEYALLVSGMCVKIMPLVATIPAPLFFYTWYLVAIVTTRVVFHGTHNSDLVVCEYEHPVAAIPVQPMNYCHSLPVHLTAGVIFHAIDEA